MSIYTIDILVNIIILSIRIFINISFVTFTLVTS